MVRQAAVEGCMFFFGVGSRGNLHPETVFMTFLADPSEAIPQSAVEEGSNG